MGRRAIRGRGLGKITLLMAASVAAALVVHCGASEPGSEFSEACEKLYQGECGKDCADDNGCAAGLHCSEGKCTAECGPGVPCNGLVCSISGRCGSAGVGPGADGGLRPDGGGVPTDACVDLTLTLARQTPTIVVLVDRSGSMTAAFPPTGTRWDALKRSLIDGGVLQQLQGEVKFGLQTYGNITGNGICPDLAGVAPGLNNYTAIDTFLAPHPTIPDTPTGEAVFAVAGLTDGGGVVAGGLASLDAGGPKVILLATDGDPDYCAVPSANNPPLVPAEQQLAKDITVNAVSVAYDAGIKTYVLAIGNQVSEAHQQEVANVGLGFAANAGDAAPFYRPSTAGELTTTINGIVAGQRSCVFALNGVVQAGKEAEGTVTLNGAALGYNNPNGWRLNNPSELELLGAACNTVKTTANATLVVRFPCGTVVIR